MAEVLAGSDAGLKRGARLGAARAIAVLAVAGTAAAALVPAGAQDRVVLRTLLAPPVDLTQYVTPLSLVRALETEFASTTLMTVSGVGEDGRVRIAALDAYDGLSARIDQGDSSRFQRVGADTPLTGAGTHSPQAREVSAYLAGVAAAKTTKTKQVGFIGGIEGAVITRFEKGFEAGVKSVDPSIKIQVDYAGGN